MVQKIVNWPFEPGSERRVGKIYENTPNYEKFIKNTQNQKFVYMCIQIYLIQLIITFLNNFNPFTSLQFCFFQGVLIIIFHSFCRFENVTRA
jgi:hypothetical protein